MSKWKPLSLRMKPSNQTTFNSSYDSAVVWRATAAAPPTTCATQIENWWKKIVIWLESQNTLFDLGLLLIAVGGGELMNCELG
jgi:hypothetical protein